MSPGRHRSGGRRSGGRRSEGRPEREPARGALRHEVALLSPDDEEIRAPALYEECAGDPKHLRARAVIAASRAGRLRCPVCGSAVERVFPAGDPGGSPEREDDAGGGRRWHFRRRRGEGECDHEGESVAHRETKTALFGALGRVLPREAGWEVFLERRLENGRRPDVLAVHASGTRVAFEVQYAAISRADWRARRDDYASLGIPDYWLLGAETRYGRTRDDLRSALREEPGQRVLWVGRFGGETAEIEAREVALSYLDPAAPQDLQGYRIRVPPSRLHSLPPDEARRLKVHEIRPPKSFPLEGISLRLVGDDSVPQGAVLFTPLDAWNAKRSREGQKRSREREELEAEATARIVRVEAERERRSGRFVDLWNRRQDGWLGSASRLGAVAKLGARVVEALEIEDLSADVGEGPPVRLRARTGGWRVLFYYREISRRAPGVPFSWPEAVGEFFAWRGGRATLPGLPVPEDPVWIDLRRCLVREDLLVPAGPNQWRVPVGDAPQNAVAGAQPVPTDSPSNQAGSTDPDGSLKRRLRRFLGRFF